MTVWLRAVALAAYVVCQMPCVLWFLLVGKLLLRDDHWFMKKSRSLVPPLSTGVYLLFFNLRLSMQISRSFPPPVTSRRFLVMTHSSTVDFMVVTAAFWVIHALCGPVICLVKKELLMMPYFGWLQLVVGSIPVGRSGDAQAAKKSLSVGEQRSREGYMVSGFPEGTRRRSASCGRDQIQTLKKGMFHLAHNVAKESGEPYYAVPMVLIGGNAAWPAKQALPVPGSKITVRIGNPISVPATESVDDTVIRVRKCMQDELEQSGAVLSDGSYNSDKAFDKAPEVPLWKVYGFEAVLMLVPTLVTAFLAVTNRL